MVEKEKARGRKRTVFIDYFAFLLTSYLHESLYRPIKLLRKYASVKCFLNSFIANVTIITVI